MIWFFLALASAILSATGDLVNKDILKKVDAITSSTGVFLASSIVLLIISAVKGIPNLGDGFFLAVLGAAVLTAIASLMFFSALKELDLSLAIPLLSFTPVFMLFSSFVLLGEFPTRGGVFGILSVVAGVYIMNFNKKHASFFKPLTELFHNPHMFYMLGVAFIFSLSSTIDKIVVLNSDPFFGSGIVYAITGGILGGVMAFKKRSIRLLWGSSHKFLLTGLAWGGSAIAANYAYMLQIAPYVVTIKRTGILFSVLYGCLVLGEKEAFNRFVGALVMVAGVVLILLF